MSDSGSIGQRLSTSLLGSQALLFLVVPHQLVILPPFSYKRKETVRHQCENAAPEGQVPLTLSHQTEAGLQKGDPVWRYLP